MKNLNINIESSIIRKKKKQTNNNVVFYFISYSKVERLSNSLKGCFILFLLKVEHLSSSLKVSLVMEEQNFYYHVPCNLRGLFSS